MFSSSMAFQPWPQATFLFFGDYSVLTGNLYTVSSLVKVYLKRYRFTEPVHLKNNLLNHSNQTDIIEPLKTDHYGSLS